MIISNGNDNIVQNILKKDDGLAIDSIDFWSPHSRNKGGMRIYWSSNKGYGNLDIVKLKGFSKYGEIDLGEDLILNCDSECMASNDNKEFIQRLMKLFVAKLNVID